LGELGTAVAAETNPACVFEPQLAELQSTQSDDGLNYLQQIQAELIARKKILTNVIVCGRSEAEEIKLRLDQITVANEDERRLKSRLLEQMDEMLYAYDLFAIKVADLGLLGTKQFSADLRTWRKNAYATVIERVGNFALWIKNQELFRTAQIRFDQINQTLKTLGVVENEEIAKLLNQTAVTLRIAKAENDSARQILLTLTDPREALRLIQASLVDLAATYENFSKLSQATQKILPH
jgi:hypothetical protein